MKKKTKFIRAINFNPIKNIDGEINTAESLTVPNQSYTVKEIIQMHERGISPVIMKKALFEQDYFSEDLNPLRKKDLDLTDVESVMREVKKANEIVEGLRKKEALKKREAERREIIEEYKKSQQIREDKNKVDPGPNKD